MNCLILHHYDPTFESGLESYGSSLIELVLRASVFILTRKIQGAPINKVIITQMELDHKSHFQLAPILDAVKICNSEISFYEMGFGWTRGDAENDPNTPYINGGLHSDVIPVYDWMLGLVSANIFLGGIFDGACLDDMETVLSELNIGYERINDLII